MRNFLIKLPKAVAIRRRIVSGETLNRVDIAPLQGQQKIPLLIKPNISGLDLPTWSKANRKYIEDLLLEHRALLFRGFDVRNLEQFNDFVSTTSDGGLLEYVDRTTPRTKFGTGVYSSTVYPSDQRIELHNEGTYWIKWARKLYFFVDTLPLTGGETPIADVRNVYKRVPEDVREKFAAKKMMLKRNYNDGFGLPWQEVFQTTDRRAVERYCSENEIQYSWKQNDRLSTRQIRPAIRYHPETGEPLWFNHVAFFHYTSLQQTVRDALLHEFNPEGLPYNTYFGDGSPISPEEIACVREAYEREKVIFPWQRGDILLLDNMTVAHAREPYSGDRKVLVCMAEVISDT